MNLQNVQHVHALPCRRDRGRGSQFAVGSERKKPSCRGKQSAFARAGMAEDQESGSRTVNSVHSPSSESTDMLPP
jgi:hypothetical protein